MVSINTISVNRAALASLRQTNAELETTQNRIASGYKVASAKDNATVWATAQTIRSDIDAQDTIKSSIALAKGQADAAYEALTSITDILQKMKTKAGDLGNAASGNDVNVTVQKELDYYQSQIFAIAKSASIKGVNFLTSADGTVASATIARDNNQSVLMDFSMDLIVNTANTPTTGVLTNGAASAYTNILTTEFTAASAGTGAGAANKKQTFIDAIDAALTTLATYTARVGSYSDSLVDQSEFLDKINDIRKTALGSLVDANMEEESAKASALQVKQQLAYQALSIGNSSAQNILMLFR